MVGRIHSVESFGTVDGPGVRLVVFLQGCPLRCLYCHNPDTWNLSGGTEMTPEQIIKLFMKNRSFYSNGGITVTGGEPLLQIEFLIELFSLATQEGIHTCLDTSGITFQSSNPVLLDTFDRLMAVTDLVLLDIKHIDPIKHQALCGASLSPVLSFAKYLDEKAIPVWIRHVFVPGFTDDDVALYDLGLFLGTLRNIKVLDVLPYHNMGEMKYQQLGLDYPLTNVLPPSKDEAIRGRDIVLNGMRECRKKLSK